MKKVCYLFADIDTNAIKHQLDAVVAAAVFDTNPLVLLTHTAVVKYESNEDQYRAPFASLSLLGVDPLLAVTSNEVYQHIREVDHVVRF